jgi:5,6,7,8-tetrahydromethanopterin hydro-lyase
MNKSMMVGECLLGDGNEVAHIDLLIGPKDGPVGEAFASALVNQTAGFTSLLSLITPNLPAKPDTIMTNKVTIQGASQALQMFGPAQAAVARAVVDSVKEGVIPKDQVDDLCIVVGVFIQWDAEDTKKIYEWNYEATKVALQRAVSGTPTIDEVLAQEAEARHPFAGGHEG